MKKQIVQNSNFAQINDEIYYFSDGITALPFSHPSLKNLID